MVVQLIKKFPAFFEPKCPPPVHIQSQLHPVPTTPSQFLKFILILSSHLCLCLPNGFFPSGFPTRTLCTPHPFPIRSTCPTHLILLECLTFILQKYRYVSWLCSFDCVLGRLVVSDTQQKAENLRGNRTGFVCWVDGEETFSMEYNTVKYNVL